ncbi:SDR family NAD(P)-dependent oxidoreductase [Rhodococcus sp. WAY2]|uniref:SDR family NAD(P)-dependent oxidoreductase n=1 Tax=Rhodococcus sp. WAY2 TaxID=2663121 RepID=UPI00131F61BF|nr:SDR family oxidoreductase [Rhodococcus sp. WAY2]QHE73323.1 short-chain dehydrogenase/reductase SDR [Rhodococcus sp. WAY2]
MTRPLILVIGAGPGVSRSVALRFARKGYDAALVGVDAAQLAALTDELADVGARVNSLEIDITDTDRALPALRELLEAVGPVDVLHFNPSAYTEQGPAELSAQQLLVDVALGVGGLLTALQAARPVMSPGARITVTGSMAADQPWHGAASLGVQKAGVRNLVQSIDAAMSADGIRAVSVTVCGMLRPDGPFSPDRVAEAIWDAAHQTEERWRTEVRYQPASDA